jgi:hypothetical protein
VVASTTVGSIVAAGGFTGITVTFDEEVNPATFTAAQVTLTGPGGAIGGVSVSPVPGSNDHKFTIAFPGQTAPGTHSLKVGPSIEDWYGNPMNQNGNGINGEPSDACTASFAQTLRPRSPGRKPGLRAWRATRGIRDRRPLRSGRWT